MPLGFCVKSKACLDCHVEISGHKNRKRCEVCVKALGHRPKYNLTDKQISKIPKYLGIISIEETAEKLKTSRSSLRRWARDNGVSFKYTGYSDEIKREVTSYYEKHGMPATRKRFPKVKVRSIIEKMYGEFSPRCVKWEENQIIEMVKMSCFIPFSDQAKYFNRPRANAGSISSAWAKKIKAAPLEIQGICKNRAKLFISKKCPFIELPFIRNEESDKEHRNLHLWIDMEKHLLPDCPGVIKKYIETMAMFQRWLWNTEDIRGEVELIKNFMELQ